MRKCDVPVPPYSAFRLLLSLSYSPCYSHAWPFAVAKATQVCTRNRTSPVAVEESPSSCDLTTRPLRRSPRHPQLSPRRRCMSSCGAETHLLFSGHSAIDASDTSARAAPGVCVGQPAPKAASKVSHEALRSSEECVGSARIAPSELRIATVRHGLTVFVIISPCFGHFGWPFPSQDGPPEKKSHLESVLSQRDRATAGFGRDRSNGKQRKLFDGDELNTNPPTPCQ